MSTLGFIQEPCKCEMIIQFATAYMTLQTKLQQAGRGESLVSNFLFRQARLFVVFE